MDNIREDAIKVINEIMENSDIKEGDIFIVGCSSSEMIGNQMGTSKDGETDAAVDALYEVMALGNKNIETSIDASAESHYMALAAEESRLEHGKLINLSKYR